MNILYPENPTRVLAEEQDEYQNLPIVDIKVNGVDYMVSCWEPTKDELKMLNKGGFITLSIMGMSHPPVMLEVQNG